MPSFFFFFNDTATTEIYTLSLHDALPISLFSNVAGDAVFTSEDVPTIYEVPLRLHDEGLDDKICELLKDRKSTRLNSSHMSISYAVFCLKKKKIKHKKRKTHKKH